MFKTCLACITTNTICSCIQQEIFHYTTGWLQSFQKVIYSTEFGKPSNLWTIHNSCSTLMHVCMVEINQWRYYHGMLPISSNSVYCCIVGSLEVSFSTFNIKFVPSNCLLSNFNSSNFWKGNFCCLYVHATGYTVVSIS